MLVHMNVTKRDLKTIDFMKENISNVLRNEMVRDEKNRSEWLDVIDVLETFIIAVEVQTPRD